jgi:nucleoside-diphosphate-sugar epimerase
MIVNTQPSAGPGNDLSSVADAASQGIAAGGRVLVTGGAGFIGSHLVETLLARGDQVTVIDTAVTATGVPPRNLAQVREHPRLRAVGVDLCSVDLGRWVDGCDVVYHLAARAGVRESWGPAFEAYARANILGTHRLVEACEQAGVPRLVVASSASVYGPTARPSRERDVPRPLSPYGVTKLAAEQLCRAHARRPLARLKVTVLRYFSVYGPRQRPDMAIHRIVDAALTGRPVRVYGDGRQRRDVTHVSDIVAATLAAADVDDRELVVNVAGGRAVPLSEVVRLVEQVAGAPVPVVAAAAAAGDVAITHADLSQARRLLGYRPRVGLAEGLQEQIAWMRAHRDAEASGKGARPGALVPQPLEVAG